MRLVYANCIYMLLLKRAYDKYSSSDGYRILVDRLYPRGVSHEHLHVNLWLKEIAPSTELRKWYNHDPKKWKEFKKKYRGELRGKKELLKVIKNAERKYKNVTLVYASKSLENNASVLYNILKK